MLALPRTDRRNGDWSARGSTNQFTPRLREESRSMARGRLVSVNRHPPLATPGSPLVAGAAIYGDPGTRPLPYRASGQLASVKDPSTWASWDSLAHLNGHYSGRGFVITAEDGFVGIDLDKCRDLTSGEIVGWAQAIIDELENYTEVSPSGTGVHVWVRGLVPPGRRQSEIGGIYDQGRYLTWLGQPLNGEIKPIAERTAELAKIHARLFDRKPANTKPTPIHPRLF